MKYRVDHVAGVERAADGIDRIPDADEADTNIAGKTVGLLEIRHRIGIRAAQTHRDKESN